MIPWNHAQRAFAPREQQKSRRDLVLAPRARKSCAHGTNGNGSRVISYVDGETINTSIRKLTPDEWAVVFKELARSPPPLWNAMTRKESDKYNSLFKITEHHPGPHEPTLVQVYYNPTNEQIVFERRQRGDRKQTSASRMARSRPMIT